MAESILEDQTFENIDFTKKAPEAEEFDYCTFVNCNFANSDLSGLNFVECEFKDCDLSMVKLYNTTLSNIVFNKCKMLGVHFEDCNKFIISMNFNTCKLNLSSFFQLKLKGIKFVDCQLNEVDFMEAGLNESVFHNCDLSGAIFEHTDLEKADLRTAHNYSIDPDLNRVKRGKFAWPGIAGLLGKYDIDIDF